MSTTLDRIQEFFSNYGPAVSLSTKHVANYMGFDPKVQVPVRDLVDHQVFIDEIKIVDSEGNVVSDYGKVVADALSNINPVVVTAIGVSLQRRFSDDHRNKENSAATRTPGLPKRIHEKIQSALESGNVELLNQFAQSLELMGETNTKEYVEINAALAESAEA